MAIMKFYNELTPPTATSQEGIYYVKNGDRVDEYLVNDGAVYCLPGTKLVLKNLVKNGNFETTENWMGVYGAISVENNILTYTADTLSTSARVNHVLMPVVDNVYFLSAEIYPPKLGSYYFRLGDAFAGVKKENFPNVWNKYEEIITAKSKDRLKIYFNTETHEVGDIYKLKNVIAINLTQIFGASNEPTLNEIKILISVLGANYFDEHILAEKDLANWHLKLIRQNRDAIINIGGTV